VTDLETGRLHPIFACSRHRPWVNAVAVADAQAVKSAGKTIPQPPQNAGGVLARHIRRIDWKSMYRNFDKDWVQPPQGESFSPPKLRLLTFESADPSAIGLHGGESKR